LNEAGAARAGSGSIGFLKATAMGEISCVLSLLAAFALVVAAFSLSLGASIHWGARDTYQFCALVLSASQAASVGLALGIAHLLRSPRSMKAWLGVLLGAGIVIAEFGLIAYFWWNNL